MLAHQLDEARLGDVGELGGLPVAEAPLANLLEEPQGTHLLGDLPGLPRVEMEGDGR